MLQPLADEDDFIPSLNPGSKHLHSIDFQVRLQLILKVFFAQEIKPVAADSAQNGMDDPGREYTVGGVQEGAQHRHQQHHAAAHPALQKRLGVPGEKGNGTDRGQVRKAAFHSPVHWSGGAWIGGGLFQIVFVPILSGCSQPQGRNLL